MITTAFIKSYFLVIVALASVTSSAIAAPYISNLVNVGSGSTSDADHSSLFHEASAQKAPYKVDNKLKANEKAGDPLRIEENINDGEQHCEMSCKYIEYQPGSNGKSSLAFTSNTPVDLTGAKKVTFFLMGENGGEKVKVKIAGKDPGPGKKGDTLLKEKFDKTSDEITLPNDWKRYEVPLDGVDLKKIKAPFGMDILKGKGSTKQVVYLKYITYEDAPVDQRFLLAANTTNSTTAAMAPAANTTNSTTALTTATAPASPAANTTNSTTTGADNRSTAVQDNNNSTTSRTPSATDVDNNSSSNETPTSNNSNNTTTGSASEEQTGEVAPNTPAQPQENQNAAPVAKLSVDRLVAHPGGTVILDGSLSSDPDGDQITYRWTQSDGPNAGITGADTATPTVTIPTRNENDQITIDLIVSDGQAESNKASVVIDIQHVEPVDGAIERTLPPEDVTAQGQGWSDTECDGDNGDAIVECLSDGSASTFVSSDMTGITTSTLFSFPDPSTVGITASNDIKYVTAQVTAKKTGASGFISLIVDDPTKSEHYTTPSISTTSNSFKQYSFTWNNNPVTGQPWTADSINALVAGYRHLAGQGSIQISEFKIIIGSLVPEVVEEEPPATSPAVNEETSTTTEEPQGAVEDGDNSGDADSEGDTGTAAPSEDSPSNSDSEGDTGTAAPSEDSSASDSENAPVTDEDEST